MASPRTCTRRSARPAVGFARGLLPRLGFALALAGMFLQMLALPAPVDAQFSTQATLTVFNPGVEVQRAATGTREPGVSGTTLLLGDRVFTDPTGQAKLTFF